MLEFERRADLFTDGVWVIDLTQLGKVPFEQLDEWFSPKFKATLGYEEHEIANKAGEFLRLIHPDDADRAKAAFRNHLEHGTRYNLLVRYLHKDGSTVWVICRGAIERDEDGKPLYMYGAHQDASRLVSQVGVGDPGGIPLWWKILGVIIPVSSIVISVVWWPQGLLYLLGVVSVFPFVARGYALQKKSPLVDALHAARSEIYDIRGDIGSLQKSIREMN